jgi:hypothetical protein
MTLPDIISDTTRKYQDFIGSGRPVPAWLQMQVKGVYQMETNYRKGLTILSEGVVQERDIYAELDKELPE